MPRIRFIKRKKRTAFEVARRWFRILLGFTTLGIGFIMLVTPGPALVAIPVGLAILASEYAWARRTLKRFKEEGEKIGAIFFTKKKK